MSKLLKHRSAQWIMWGLIGCIYLVPLLTVNGAFDAFLKIEGIEGESVDDRHKGWIDVDSYQWRADKPVDGYGSNRTTRVTTHQDFTVTKWVDKSSPKLMLAVCDGQHIPSVRLEMVRTTSNTVQTMAYDLLEAIVTSVRPGGGSTQGQEEPTEAFSLNYAKIAWTYTEQDRATGAITYQDSASCEVEDPGTP